MIEFIFIITSTLKPTVGIIDHAQRIRQTQEGILSIKTKAPGSFILLIDNSSESLPEKLKHEIQSMVDIGLFLETDSMATVLSRNGLKSLGETYLLLKALK